MIDDTLEYSKRLLKYIHSEHSLQRAYHVKLITKVIKDKEFNEIEKILNEVLPVASHDTQSYIRLSLAEELQPIMKILKEHGDKGLEYIKKNIIIILKDLLHDSDNGVKEAASCAFCYCSSLFPTSVSGNLLLPIAIELVHDNDNDEFTNQVTAAPLLNKLSNYLGTDITNEFIIPAIICLSGNKHFQVRKATASSFNDICNITYPDVILFKLLPSFFKLCNDEVWSVRKTCCDALLSLCKVVPDDIKISLLCDAFIKFSKDVSKWVKSAYYRNLGDFISNLPGDKVPEKMIDDYCSFSKSNPLFTNDMLILCAKQFVGVLNSLGKAYWIKLKPVMIFLAKHQNDQIRKEVASNIHLV